MDGTIELLSDSSSPSPKSSSFITNSVKSINSISGLSTDYMYRRSTTKSTFNINGNNIVSSDDEELPQIHSNNQINKINAGEDENNIIHELAEKYKMPNRVLESPHNLRRTRINTFQSNLKEDFKENEVFQTKRRKVSSRSKEDRNAEKAALRTEKKLEREKKKEEADRIKAINQALRASHKNLKPEECVKLITTIIDSDIMSEIYSSEILSALQTSGVKYKVQSQMIPFVITWTTTNQTHLIGDNGQLALSSELSETDHVMLVMNWKEVISLVHNNSLSTHIKSIQSIFSGKKVQLAIYGLQNYYKNQKVGTSANENLYRGVPHVSRRDLEIALTELQLLCSCCHQMLETPQDVGMMVAQFSKAIARIPYKLEKQQKYEQAAWYISGDNKDCVRVDKSGNGLKRLWQQQLTSFSLARLEVAEAIASKYPTPSTLMKAYNNCSSTEEAEKLLKDIPIRRAAGPLTSVRKIGPELSRKVHTFFTATDGHTVI